jgi:hypothetical protein
MPDKITAYDAVEPQALALSAADQERLILKLANEAPENSPLKTIITLLEDADI